MRLRLWKLPALAVALVAPIMADSFFFSTGSPDGKMAAASQPSAGGKIEIETGDDFVLTSQIQISGASFAGLLTGGATLSNIADVRIEIYRVFPNDSDVNRTSGPPTFTTPDVPTRVNSPSDVEFADRDSADGNLSFTPAIVNASFTAANSVAPGGIHPKPGNNTGGDGAVTGEEVQFNVLFTTPFDLPADHYFFVPQVEVSTAGGEFYWLSAPRPIVLPGTAFPPGFTDLQAWTRDENLAPDWLRIGTDIVGGQPAPTFNMAFSLSGDTVPSTVPEPASYVLFSSVLLTIASIARKKFPRA